MLGDLPAVIATPASVPIVVPALRSLFLTQNHRGRRRRNLMVHVLRSHGRRDIPIDVPVALISLLVLVR